MRRPGHTAGTRDSAAVIHGGEVVARNHKHHLPNYGVFDEKRWFAPGTETTVVRWRGVDFGIVVCEDIWQTGGPVTALSGQVDVLLVPNASPYERDKDEVRIGVIGGRAAEVGAPLAYVNLIGGQDDLVFDGGSMVILPDGSVLARAAQFVEELALVDLEIPPADRPAPTVATPVAVRRISLDLDRARPTPTAWTSERSPVAPVLIEPLDAEAEVWNALVLGLRDYTSKTGFALGGRRALRWHRLRPRGVARRVTRSVLTPCTPSPCRASLLQRPQPRRCSRNGQTYGAAGPSSHPDRADGVHVRRWALKLTGLAEENVQARVRGTILMGLSNSEGHLVLAPETRASCRRLFDDLRRRRRWLAPLKDVPKTLVSPSPAGATPMRRVAARRRRSRRTPSPNLRRPSCVPGNSTPTPCPTTTCSRRARRLRRGGSLPRRPRRRRLRRDLVERVMRMTDGASGSAGSTRRGRRSRSAFRP